MCTLYKLQMLSWHNALILLIFGKNFTSSPKIERHVLTTSKLQCQVTNVTCWYLSVLSDHDVWRMPVTNERHVLTTSKLQCQVTNVTSWYLSVLSDHDVWRMPVTNAEDERGNTVPGTGLCECVNGLKVLGICTTGNKQAYRKTSNKRTWRSLEHGLPNP